MSLSTSTDSISELDVAIIGMAGRFPGARNIDEFWQNLINGVESISQFSDEELKAEGVPTFIINDPNYIKARGIIDDAELFDALFFGFYPKEAELMDPQQRLFLECAHAALECAGYATENYSGLIGVFGGVGMNTYLLRYLAANRGFIKSAEGYQLTIGNDKDFLTTRISYKLNLRGPSVDLQTACSTSLVATHFACQSLLNYQSDIALAGGSTIFLPQKSGYYYQEGMILSPDGHCRAFDANARGTVAGNGAAVVVLKRLVDAVTDRDHIYAVIKGSACNNDGANRVGYTAPSVEGQSEVIAAAQAIAGVEPQSITYIEAHGTGTSLGDPIEIEALGQVFREKTDAKGFCAVGSVKTNVGHLDTAAGVTGLIKTALALKHKQIPPSLHYEKPNPRIDFKNSPFYVNAKLKDWQRNGGPRRAGLSSFGIGGTNVHMVLEEAPIVRGSESFRPWQLLTVSARSSSALDQARKNLGVHLKNHPEIDLTDVAYTLQIGRKEFNHRLIAVCESGADAATTLETNDPRRIFTAFHNQTPENKPVVFMFSGQGAQYVNMGLELYHSEPVFREWIEFGADFLKPILGFDLRTVLYPETDVEAAEKKLEQTFITQPALFVIEYALAKTWLEWGIKPAAMIGHSIGEYVAACLAGVFSIEDALTLVAARGRLMQKMPTGAMLSVPLAENQIKAMMTDKLALAAINSASLCVVSGPNAEIEKFASQLNEKGIEFRRLHTSHAFHSDMMEPILTPFTEQVKKVRLNSPTIPFISNVSGTWITALEATDPNYWARHLRQTVRFADGIYELLQDSQRILLEVGPGQTLATLARRHPANSIGRVILASMRHPQEKQSDAGFLLTTLGKLWLSGIQVDWNTFYANQKRCRVPLPTYPFERQRYWLEVKATNLAADGSEAGPGKKTNIADWFYLPNWLQVDGLPQPGILEKIPANGKWLIFAAEAELCSLFMRNLKAAGQQVNTVFIGQEFTTISENIFTINPGDRSDYDLLYSHLAAANQLPDQIVHFWNYSELTEPNAKFSFEEYQSFGFYSLLFLAQAIGKANQTQPVQITVVTSHVHQITGTERLTPDQAPLLGACQVIPQEYRQILCKCIDITETKPLTDTELIPKILTEILSGSEHRQIAFRGKHRWIQKYTPYPLASVADRPGLLKDQGVYLITGGLGRIGMAFADYLAQQARPRLILLDRLAFPERTEWQNWLNSHPSNDPVSLKIKKIMELEDRDAEVLVLSVNISDAGQLEKALARATKRFGLVNGVFHAAGLVGENAFRTIQETNIQECRQQFEAKVHGIKALVKVLHGQKLDFWILQSSLSAVLGGLGFAAYAASNHFLNALARQQSQNHSTPWISVCWDGWRFADTSDRQAGFGMEISELTIVPEEGIQVLHRILTQAPASQVVVSTGDLDTRIKEWIEFEARTSGEAGASDAIPGNLHARPNLQTTFVAPTTEVEQKIASLWQKLLGIEAIGLHDNFFELGGNSLLGTQLVSQLRDLFRVELPLRSLFEDPTVAGVAKIIESSHQAKSDEMDKIAQLLDKMGQLSDEEVKSLLKDKKATNE